jgi:hypothetical protein
MVFTRVEINSHAIVPGGIAADNNSVEAVNSAHKKHMFEHNQHKPQVHLYVDYLAAYVQQRSYNSTEFGSNLNVDVHSNEFYASVFSMLNADISPLTITWERAKGVVVIISQFTINFLWDLFGEKGTKRTNVSIKRGAVGWLKQFEAMVKDPKTMKTISGGSCTFQDLCGVDKRSGYAGWARAFYFLTPIPHETNYLKDHYARLVDSGLEMIPFEELLLNEEKGLMSCSCSKFLHRAWCIHTCVDAFAKHILTGYPKNMDPTSLKPTRGRPNEKGKPRLFEQEI